MTTRIRVLFTRFILSLFRILTFNAFEGPKIITPKRVTHSELMNMSLNELWNANIEVGESEIYSYLAAKTNNWDQATLNFLYEDICSLADDIRFFIYDPDAEKYKTKNSIIRYHLDYSEDITRLKSYSPISYQEIIGRYCYEYQKDNDSEDFNSKDFSNIIELLENTYDCYVDETQMLIIEIITEEINKELDKSFLSLKEANTSNTINQITNKSKSPEMTFKGLFNFEYSLKLSEFKKILLQTGYINPDGKWRTETDLNEASELFNWLIKEKHVIKPIRNHTAALKCFYKEFGMTVYSNREERPAEENRPVNFKGLLDSYPNSTRKKEFEKFFKNWI